MDHSWDDALRLRFSAPATQACQHLSDVEEVHVQDHVTLKGGVRIPKIGCGTWQLRATECAQIVAEALRLGYRHVDTAQGYENEAAVGEGIRASGIPREEIFITTKVRPDFAADGALQKSTEDSLKRLGTGVIDLLLLHWPSPTVSVSESARALSDAKSLGLTKHIGVSNLTVAKLDEAIRSSPEPLVAAQIEYHPYLNQSRILAAIRGHGLAVIAYCPIALGKVANDPHLVAIGAKHYKTAAQVTLRWLIQQDDVAAIPKTAQPARLRENLSVFDFRLSDIEMGEIRRLVRPNSRLVNEPQWVPKWDD
jgi:2,5-diketo-D-gluconate reductase B